MIWKLPLSDLPVGSTLGLQRSLGLLMATLGLQRSLGLLMASCAEAGLGPADPSCEDYSGAQEGCMECRLSMRWHLHKHLVVVRATTSHRLFRGHTGPPLTYLCVKF